MGEMTKDEINTGLFDECKRLRAKIEALEAKHPCKWYQESDIDSTYYETACGASFQFTNDGPAENGMKFCHNCGKPVFEIPQEDKTDELS